MISILVQGRNQCYFYYEALSQRPNRYQTFSGGPDKVGGWGVQGLREGCMCGLYVVHVGLHVECV